MGLMDKIKGIGTQVTTAAKEQARAALLPNIITAKKMEVMGLDGKLDKLDKEARKLGWSPQSRSPEAMAMRAEIEQLVTQKAKLTAELSELQAEHQQNVSAAERQAKKFRF